MYDQSTFPCSSDDSLRFRLSVSRTVPRSSVQISVEVVALIGAEDADSHALEQRVVAALGRFIQARWTVSSIERSEDNSGYERVLLRAHSRVPPDENHNLADRLRGASVTGIAIQTPTVDYALEPGLLAEHTHGLQDEIVQAAGLRAERFAEITGRPWRLGDIRFGLRDDGNDDFSPKRVGRQSAMASYEGGIGLSERLVLVAEVTLRAVAPTRAGARDGCE